jgi:hypothetical protein
VEEVEEDDVDCVNEVDILEEVSGSRSSVVEDIEAIVDLEEVVVWTMDMVVNWSCAERVVVSVVTEDDVELELDVLTSGNTELGTLEKAAELVWNVDELDTVAKGSKESVENDVEVEEEKEDDAVDEISIALKNLLTSSSKKICLSLGQTHLPQSDSPPLHYSTKKKTYILFEMWNSRGPWKH